jgi:hypothetical protein
MPFTTIQSSGTKVIGASTLILQQIHPDVAAGAVLASSLGSPLTKTQIDNINNFVWGAVAAGLWTKYKAVYLFVGGAANNHMINWKDARNVDAAFRLSFVGGWTHDANGSTPNGSTGYANTFFNTSTNFASSTNACLSFYSGTNSNTGLPFDIGNSSGATGTGNVCCLVTRYPGDRAYAAFGGPTSVAASAANTESRGYFSTNRNGGNTEMWWCRAGETGMTRVINATETWTRNNLNLFISTNNGAGVPSGTLFSNKRVQFVHFGDTLTADEIQIQRNLVQALQQSLGRAF